jgi:uncharacterized protein (DUF1015 family)
MDALDAQTGPAFLTYRASPVVDQIVARANEGQAETEFVAVDGVRHESWTLFEREQIELLRSAFAQMVRLYIADGHHRTAAAARVDEARSGQGDSDRFLAVVFPHDQVQVLAYHRVVNDLNGLSPDSFLERLRSICEVKDRGSDEPAERHALGLFLDQRWYSLTFKDSLWNAQPTEEALDVALLQRCILGPVLGIEDQRTSGRIQFVGGIRGTAELEKRVKAGRGGCAFSLFPTSMDELMTVADGGGIMPPKSTWFEPKLRDGLFTHVLSQ